jgi:hypothetical protein
MQRPTTEAMVLMPVHRHQGFPEVEQNQDQAIGVHQQNFVAREHGGR